MGTQGVESLETGRDTVGKVRGWLSLETNAERWEGQVPESFFFLSFCLGNNGDLVDE